MAKVSARSRNQYSVVGDSGKVVWALEVNASHARRGDSPSAGRRKPASVWCVGRAG